MMFFVMGLLCIQATQGLSMADENKKASAETSHLMASRGDPRAGQASEFLSGSRFSFSLDQPTTLIIIIVAALGVIIMGLCMYTFSSKRTSYKAFGDKSGLSTSSSDITSSETGSTDRELKSRMERFEKRL